MKFWTCRATAIVHNNVLRFSFVVPSGGTGITTLTDVSVSFVVCPLIVLTEETQMSSIFVERKKSVWLCVRNSLITVNLTSLHNLPADKLQKAFKQKVLLCAEV